MVTTIVQTKEPVAETVVGTVYLVKPEDLVKLVDELGDIKLKLERAKPLIARVAVIEKAIRQHIDAATASDKDEVVYGETWEIKVGKKPWVRKIVDKLKALTLLTQDVALEKVTIPLAVLDDYLTPDERDQVLSKTRDGTRPLKISKR